MAYQVQALMTSGARYEIAIDGTTRTYDREGIAREAATHLKRKNPPAVCATLLARKSTRLGAG